MKDKFNYSKRIKSFFLKMYAHGLTCLFSFVPCQSVKLQERWSGLRYSIIEITGLYCDGVEW
jgi:hypothetical protein